MKKIGEIFRNLRKARGVTARHVGERIGVDEETIYRMEKIGTQPPQSDTFRLLCEFYDLKTQQVIAMTKGIIQPHQSNVEMATFKRLAKITDDALTFRALNRKACPDPVVIQRNEDGIRMAKAVGIFIPV